MPQPYAPTSSPIGVGIVGVTPGQDFRSAGWANAAHLPALAALDMYELRALSSRRLESARETARQYGVPKAYVSTAELAADPEVDLAVITIRVPAHADAIATVFDAGKRVFCEWPLANGLGLRSGVCLQARGSPVIRHVRDLIRQGWIGDLLSTSLVGSGMNWGPGMPLRNDYTLAKGNGATLLSIAVGHALDALQYCLGDIVELNAMSALRRREISFSDGTVLPVTAEDQWVIAARLANGAPASVHYRDGQMRGDNLLWEINGSDDDLRITSTFGNIQPFALELHGARGNERLRPIAIPAADDCVPGLGDPARNVAQTYCLFAVDLANGTRECADFDAALKLHMLLDAIERSAVSGQRARRTIDGEFQI